VVVNRARPSRGFICRRNVNSLLSVGRSLLADSKATSMSFVSDKQNHLQYLGQWTRHTRRNCTKGIGLWSNASTDQGYEPDVVMASAGDIPTERGPGGGRSAATGIPHVENSLRPNVVESVPTAARYEHPHGLSDRDFDSLFTLDKPIIFCIPRLSVADSPSDLSP